MAEDEFGKKLEDRVRAFTGRRPRLDGVLVTADAAVARATLLDDTVDGTKIFPDPEGLGAAAPVSAVAVAAPQKAVVVAKRAKISLLVDEDLHRRLKVHCSLQRISLQDYLTSLLLREADTFPRL